MSLIAFHRFLIATATVFCGGFAAWEFLAYLRDGGLPSLLTGIASAAAAMVLGYYLRHLPRFLGVRDRTPSSRRPS